MILLTSEGKHPNQRLKILYLYNILLQYTDEKHSITMPDIIRKLELYGITAARKALYEDIEALKSYGLDIICVKGNSSGYYVASRDFELPELKLLADAVTSSRFLTERKSNQLLKKIESLASIYEGKQIGRQVFVTNRVKAMNERIYQNVDAIHKAIAEKKQIVFNYFEYDINKKKKYHAGNHQCSPYALIWDDERYYLVAFYDKYPDKLTNFRVDRMEHVNILIDDAHQMPKDFDLSDYLKSTFSMFSGEVTEIRLLFDNSLINPVFDRFGKDTMIIPVDDYSFEVNVKIKAEPPFFGWLFQFGNKAQIVSPNEIKNKYKEMLDEVILKVQG